jgi:hypothetical protein
MGSPYDFVENEEFRLDVKQQAMETTTPATPAGKVST